MICRTDKAIVISTPEVMGTFWAYLDGLRKPVPVKILTVTYVVEDDTVKLCITDIAQGRTSYVDFGDLHDTRNRAVEAALHLKKIVPPAHG